MSKRIPKNPYKEDPKMMILQADPGRYIKTASGAVIAVIKAAMTVIAFSWMVRMLACLKMLFFGQGQMLPVQVLQVLLPQRISEILLSGAMSGRQMTRKVLESMLASGSSGTELSQEEIDELARSSGLTPEQIQALSGNQSVQLTPEQIQSLTDSGLSQEEINALYGNGGVEVTPEQLDALLSGDTSSLGLGEDVDVNSLLSGTMNDLLTPGGQVDLPIPGEVTKFLFLDGIPGAELILNILGMAAALAFLVVFLSMCVEGVAALLLRFALKGSQVMKITHNVIHKAVIVLAIAFGLSCIMQVLGYFTGGSENDGAIRLLIASVVCTALLLLRISYHKGAFTVLSAIDFEIQYDFKETAMDRVSLGRDSLIFGFLLIVGTIALGFLAGWTCVFVYVLAILAVKYFAVYNSWMDFQRRHM